MTSREGDTATPGADEAGIGAERDTLRTVRVRLALALLGAATLPIAAVALVVGGSRPLDVTLAIVGLGLVALLLIRRLVGQVLGAATALDDAQQRFRRLYAAEREASLLDHLTGLGNHRAYQEELTRAFDQAARYRVTVALVLLDLDEFKQVNDTLGHAVGDDLLADVGRLVRETIRVSDRAFRIGGDEFAVIAPHTTAAGAHELGERLLRRLLTERGNGRYLLPISFSAGVAAAPDHATTRVELHARADAALYRSKRSGRTTVTIFDPTVDRGSINEQTRGDLSARVATVATTRALTAVYQPIVSLADGRALAWEGLVRPAPGCGFENAGLLFAAAELTGRTIDLDRACLEVVVGAARGLGDARLSLNLSPRTFEAPEFSANALLGILRRAGLDPRQVILELTERETIHDLDRLRVALSGCRAAGILVAADDVGAGNAGLRLLSQIRFDVMKIDLSLVQAGAGNEPVISVLSTLVDLARRWGALVVAEGVETDEQLRMVRNLGVDAVQGYLLGRPQPLIGGETYDIEGLSARAALPAWAARAAS